MGESEIEWVLRVTEGDQTSVLAGPNVMLKAEFRIDASKSPKHIDYLGRKAQAGIYEFEGGLLKIHMGAPGGKRPTGFLPAAGGTLTVWKKN